MCLTNKVAAIKTHPVPANQHTHTQTHARMQALNMLMSLQKSILQSVQSDDVLLELPPVACVVLVLQFCWCKCVYYAISSQNHNHHRRNRRGWTPSHTHHIAALRGNTHRRKTDTEPRVTFSFQLCTHTQKTEKKRRGVDRRGRWRPSLCSDSVADLPESGPHGWVTGN